MPEDAGKKKFIKDFLQSIKSGEGFNGDIHVERSVKLPGTEGKSSTAQSLSGKPVDNITQLLEDDLKHSFDEGYFTFRFVAALVGSGKTFLLTHLHELIKTHKGYEGLSVVSRFQLSDLLFSAGNQSFSVRLYCYLLAQTFWELLNSSNRSIKDVGSSLLKDYLEDSEVVQLEATKKQKPFRSKFTKYLADSGVIFEEFFFDVVEEVSNIEPQFTFAYLIDELDSLQNYPKELQETRSLIKALIKRASHQYRSKIRILIYLVGTSENVWSFIDEDSVIKSLVGNLVINLSQGYGNEFEAIRAKIDNRIEGAFKGYKDFELAWQEIQGIPLTKAQNLRSFCQKYATAVLEIYEKYFREEPEKKFEGNARELVEAQCRQKWQKYLQQRSYQLSAVSTTTILKGHAFDCYIELRHNDSCIARGFGEAKNYELISSHFKIFCQWLEDVKFKSSTTDRTPHDLAFIIAPSCAPLLQRKLELKNIQFIQSNKIKQKSNKTEYSTPMPVVSGVDLNTADKSSIISAVKGSRLQSKKIDKLIARRKKKKYKTLEELTSDIGVGDSVKQKLQDKMENGQICLVE